MKSLIDNKKGITWRVLVAVILVVFSTALLLPAVLNIGETMNQAQDKSCAFNLFLSSTTKMMGKEMISPECQHKTYRIGKENITSFAKTNSIKKSQDYLKQLDEQEYGEYRNLFFEGSQDEWYLDEFMAKELKNCWDTVGRGDYDLFDEWWSFLDCSDTNVAKPCDTEAAALEKLAISFSNRKKIPTFCILCSSIHFEDNLPEQINEKEVSTLDEWLAANPVPRSNTPYNIYLMTNTNVQNLRPNFETYKTSESQAIVYMKKQKTALDEIGDYMKITLNDLMGEKVSDIDKIDHLQYVDIVDYDELYDECSYLVG